MLHIIYKNQIWTFESIYEFFIHIWTQTLVANVSRGDVGPRLANVGATGNRRRHDKAHLLRADISSQHRPPTFARHRTDVDFISIARPFIIGSRCTAAPVKIIGCSIAGHRHLITLYFHKLNETKKKVNGGFALRKTRCLVTCLLYTSDAADE